MNPVVTHPKISVIIPTYNRALLLDRAVRSVMGQTFTDFELIIVDDGSTDTTPAYSTSLNDVRVRYERHPESKGPSAARNTGIRLARGSFIAFLDSDDAWHPEKLYKQLSCFAGAPHAGLVYTGALRYTGELTDHLVPRYRGGNMLPRLLVGNCIGSPTAVMISRTVVEKTGYFDEALKGREDLDYWIRIAEKFDCEYVNEELAVLYTESTDRVSFNSRIVDAYRYFFRKHLPLLKKYRCCSEHVRRGAKFIYSFTGDRNAALDFLRMALRESPFELQAWYNYIRYAVKWK